MATLIWAGNILKVAFGLGFVIFWHELGHFLLAKWNGVKVEKFSIGFGKTLLGFTRGETEYVLALIPLGGFVKMLGENPEGDDTKTSDPRAYQNKSVPARMAIISAGVIMNLILGLACFALAYGRGMEEQPATVGGVQAGSPAYQAGLRAGDDVLAIDGRRGVTFSHLLLKVRLSARGQKLRFLIARPGAPAPLTFDIEPQRQESVSFPMIGVYPSEGLTLADPPYRAPLGVVDPPKDESAGLHAGDRVVAAGPEGGTLEPVADIFALDALLARYRDRPLRVQVERAVPPRSGKIGGGGPSTLTETVTLPPNHFVDLGLRMTIEPVRAIVPKSIADKAGFLAGDVIAAVDGDEAFDPMRLPDYCRDHAGREVTFRVRRGGMAGREEGTIELKATPDASPTWIEPTLAPGEPLKVPGLGLAYPVRPRVAAVAPGSPAAQAGIKAGDLIGSLRIKGVKPGKSEPLAFDDRKPDWARAFSLMQLQAKAEVAAVELTVNGSKTPVAVRPAPDADWYNPLRGLVFNYLSRRLPPQDVRASLRRGFDDTVDTILSTYAMLRSLFQQRVSPKTLGGPIKIAQVAYASADTGLTELIHFLGILSINLAVLNFLPVPPLDGGQFLYLAAEGVRGKPLQASAQNFFIYIGIFLLLCLMVFVIFQDIYQLIFH